MASAATEGTLENPSSDYFKSLFGFNEFSNKKKKKPTGRYFQDGGTQVHTNKTYKKLQSMFTLNADETKLVSLANKRSFHIGSYKSVSSDELVVDVMAQRLMADWSNVTKTSEKFRRPRAASGDYDDFLPSPKIHHKRVDFAYGLFDRDLLERERCPECTKRLLSYVKQGRRCLIRMMSQFNTPDGKRAVELASERMDGDTFLAKQTIFKSLTQELVKKFQQHYGLDEHLLCKICAQKPALPIRRRRDSLLHESARFIITHLTQTLEAFDVSTCPNCRQNSSSCE